ncbi:hypothetical protein AB0P21_40230 [Kribbella sp. NPDC056861]|uniref:hypothetical protein n=1 Tax=Kribbella sp. NPDC056861 TaxID=3154857 RepID=UPI00342E4503
MLVKKLLVTAVLGSGLATGLSGPADAAAPKPALRLIREYADLRPEVNRYLCRQDGRWLQDRRQITEFVCGENWNASRVYLWVRPA